MDLKQSKYLWVVPIVGFIFTISCNNRHPSADTSENQLMKSSTLKSESGNLSPAHKSDVKHRISEDLKIIREKIVSLDDQIYLHYEKLSPTSRSRSEQLRSDLVRIEKNLKIKLDDIENSFWHNTGLSENSLNEDLEKTEDELRQINEQIDEWSETNIK